MTSFGEALRRRRTALLVTAVVRVSVGGGAAVLTVVASHVVEQAGAAVGSWNGVRYEGTVTDSGGLNTDVELTVASDGSAYGELRRPFGASAEIGFGDAETVIRGNREWWMPYGAAEADRLAGRWVADPPAAVTGLPATDLLTPASLGRALAPPGAEPWTRTGDRDIDGRPGRAWSDDHRDVVLSADGAPRVLAVDVPLVEGPYSLTLPVDGGTADPDEYARGIWEAQIDATVTAPTDDELKELEELLGQAEELAGKLEEIIEEIEGGAEEDGPPADGCGPRDSGERAPDGGVVRPAEAPVSRASVGPDPSVPWQPPTSPPPPPLPGRDGVMGGVPAAPPDARSALDPTGGVDLSSVELRYVRDRGTGGGIEYAFLARPTADGEPLDARTAGARQASDAFFVWLALPPSSFWVNLSPDEPDRIIDPQLARTDAGRILLQADLEMKKARARLLNPDTPLGARYWDSVERYNDGFCSPTPGTGSRPDRQRSRKQTEGCSSSMRRSRCRWSP